MAAKKIKKYVICNDADGEATVWGLHSDLTFLYTSLTPMDIETSQTPSIDLRKLVGDA